MLIVCYEYFYILYASTNLILNFMYKNYPHLIDEKVRAEREGLSSLPKVTELIRRAPKQEANPGGLSAKFMLRISLLEGCNTNSAV